MIHDNEKLEHLRHSAAHLLAAAIRKLYPDAKRTIGPAIDTGFYYDFDFSAQGGSALGGGDYPTEKDLPRIEQKMHDLLEGWKEFTHKEVSVAEAKEFFKDNPYKLELIEEFARDGQTLTFYSCGSFTDLCRGGHSEDPSKELQNFKLLSLAGAYWRGSEKNKMLTRIYGTAFFTAAELTAYLTMQEEAKKRDHRKLGRELELFMISDEVGGGLPMFYPKGALLRRFVESYITEMQESKGYVPIWIPHITKGKLYEISGHLDKYDAMYPPMELKDEANYYMKPMNCPHFMMLYKSLPHSYRELPLRYTCTTTNYRYEKSGELSGLTRVRALTQDDCHVFTRPEQIENEVNLMLDMIGEAYQTFGFNDFWVRISVRDPENMTKYIGDPNVWNESEAALARLIEQRGWAHEVGVGEAAFYGPKLDFMVKDAIGREWQLSTIQLDMNLPQRFELEYQDSDGMAKRPVVIHRAILGSTERFLGILIEHYAGAFPVWLSPVQILLAPIAERHFEGAHTLAAELRARGMRVVVNDTNETLGNKVRKAAAEKVPYFIAVGDKELAGESWMVRVRGQEQQLQITKDEFIEKVQTEIKEKK